MYSVLYNYNIEKTENCIFRKRFLLNRLTGLSFYNVLFQFLNILKQFNKQAKLVQKVRHFLNYKNRLTDTKNRLVELFENVEYSKLLSF